MKIKYFSLSLLSVLFLQLNADPLVDQSTLFDYSAAINGFTAEIAMNQVQLDAVNAQIDLLQSVTGYSSVVSPALDDLYNQQNTLTNTIADMQAVLTEITDLYNLDPSIQAQLYYFYTVVDGPFNDFMVRMPFNYQTALIDPIILELLADVTNNADEKTVVAKLVFANYQINQSHIQSLVKLYRYIF